MDIVGKRTLWKVLHALGASAPRGRRLHQTTLGAELLSNSAYYSLAGLGNPRTGLWKGAALGLAAGLGAVAFPKRMRLGWWPGKRSPKAQFLTVAWYLLGGLTAGFAAKSLAD